MKHKEGNFKGYKDFNIYYQRWLPEGSARAVLLVAHGFAEHSGRYGNLVNYFVPKGYAVYALDHRGHGRSDGERVQVERFTDYLTDLKTFFNLVRKENPNKKIFLVGHSMGAMISTAYTVKYQKELAGLILSGGGITTKDMPVLRVTTASGALDASSLSRDKAVVDAYVNDPLVYRGPIPDRPPMDETRRQLPEQVPGIKLPILIMAGSAAPMGDAARSRALYEKVGSKDKTLKLYEGLLHEIFNEPEHKQVMADMEAWLAAHM
jgi:alpha-beta hydrolase superfamily lysophospholipase